MRLSIGAILIVTVPETIMRSEWRGDAHGTIPKRSTSNRDANVAIISIAQQASPNEMMATFASDRKSTRLNSSHVSISYAGLCLHKKNGRRLQSLESRRIADDDDM